MACPQEEKGAVVEQNGIDHCPYFRFNAQFKLRKLLRIAVFDNADTLINDLVDVFQSCRIEIIIHELIFETGSRIMRKMFKEIELF